MKNLSFVLWLLGWPTVLLLFTKTVGGFNELLFLIWAVSWLLASIILHEGNEEKGGDNISFVIWMLGWPCLAIKSISAPMVKLGLEEFWSAFIIWFVIWAAGGCYSYHGHHHQ